MSNEFDNDLLSAIKNGMVRAINEGDFKTARAVNDPLAAAMSRRAAELDRHFDEALTEILSEGSFKETLKEQTRKSLARAIVGGMQATIDKSVQKLKSDPVRNAKIIQAVNAVLEEFDAKPA